MPFFTRVFRGKDATASKKPSKPSPLDDAGPPKPSWTDAWQRTEVAPEEVQDLLRACTKELKARGMWTGFFLDVNLSSPPRSLRWHAGPFSILLDRG